MNKARTSLIIDDELKEKIKAEAEKQSRTPHNMMVYILKRYFDDKEQSNQK